MSTTAENPEAELLEVARDAIRTIEAGVRHFQGYDCTRDDTQPTRRVAAPDRMVWVDGSGDIPGTWVHERELDGTRPVERDGLDVYVRVPADEPARLAELMHLAAEVEGLRQTVNELRDVERSTR